MLRQGHVRPFPHPLEPWITMHFSATVFEISSLPILIAGIVFQPQVWRVIIENPCQREHGVFRIWTQGQHVNQDFLHPVWAAAVTGHMVGRWCGLLERLMDLHPLLPVPLSVVSIILMNFWWMAHVSCCTCHTQCCIYSFAHDIALTRGLEHGRQHHTFNSWIHKQQIQGPVNLGQSANHFILHWWVWKVRCYCVELRLFWTWGPKTWLKDRFWMLPS